MYISWSFFSSQHKIDSLQRGDAAEFFLPIDEDHRLENDGIDHRRIRQDHQNHSGSLSFSTKKNVNNRHREVPFLTDTNGQVIPEKNPLPVRFRIPPPEEEFKAPPVSDKVAPPLWNKNADNLQLANIAKESSNNVLPRSRDSAFNERMKSSLYSPEADNVLPNYFIHAESRNQTRDQYGKTVVTYLHHNKAAGSSVKDCLRKVSVAERKRISLMDSGGRVASVSRLKRGNHFQFYMGGYAFGICKQLSPEPCSYFTFVRDPYERVISSYSYCRRAASDQLCQPGDPWAMSIKDWVLFQGSFLFRQILFRPDYCKVPTPPVKNKKGRPAGVPCWYKEKQFLKEKLNETLEDDLIEYVVSNLDKWFAVIGITEDYDTSLAMLEEAYGIPFHTKCSGKKINVSDYKNMQRGQNTNQTDHELFVERTKRELMADEDVQKALRGDVKIYQQAQLIFEEQRQKYKEIKGL